jgi:oxygen-dependent protoporphyrinogen oxidase
LSKHIVIVGGGITGLAAAYEAKVNNTASNTRLKVTVLEQAERFGGKIKSHQTEDFIIEAGPDSIYTRKLGGLELISELGLESEMVYSPAHAKTAILRHQHLYPLPQGMTFGLPTNLRAFVFNSLIPWRGKLRGLRDFYLPPTPDSSKNWE